MATAKQLAVATELPLFSGDLQSLQGMADNIAAGDVDLLGVTIANHRGDALVHHGAVSQLSNALPRRLSWSQEQDGQYWRLSMPVLPTLVHIDDMIGPDAAKLAAEPSEPLGYVVLDVSLKRLAGAREKVFFLGVLVIVVAILLSVAAMVWLARGVILPLSRIIEGVAAMGKGNLDVRIDGDQCDVMRPLALVINQMAEGVKLTQAELQQRIEAATLELREAKAHAEQEARIDPLTGLYNRRAFMERASDELLRALRYRTPLSLAMIDLDHFKAINDRWGHAIGDQVLIAFADILKRSMRAVDVVARIGGEEFVLLMTETPVEEAMWVAERIRKDVEAAVLQVSGTQLHWTASFGVTLLQGNDYSVSTALQRADKALYRAKAGGRNRVEAEVDDLAAPLD